MNLDNHIEKIKEIKKLKDEYLHLQYKANRITEMKNQLRVSSAEGIEEVIIGFQQQINDLKLGMRETADRIIIELL